MFSAYKKNLENLNKKGAITSNHEILVIPSINQYAMNIGKRFWAVDDTDINRMFLRIRQRRNNPKNSSRSL